MRFGIIDAVFEQALANSGTWEWTLQHQHIYRVSQAPRTTERVFATDGYDHPQSGQLQHVADGRLEVGR
jgi:hypothetical protein